MDAPGAEERAAPGETDLVIAANTLPARFDERQERWIPAPGGLAMAMRQFLERRGSGLWIGATARSGGPPLVPGIDVVAVPVDADTYRGYYTGFANQVLWPIVHGRPDLVVDDPHWWHAYRMVNAAFSDAIIRHAPRRATVWVHDYHLLLVPSAVRAARPDLAIGLFLHTPAPSAVELDRAVQADALRAGMGGAHVIGVQRERDVAALAPHVDCPVFAAPISVDATTVRSIATDRAVAAMAQRLRARLARGRRMFLGVDRLDYSKGIVERLEAFEQLLRVGLVTPDEVVFVQIAAPSREDVPAYRQLSTQVQRLVAQINAAHPGGPVVELVHENLPFREVMAHYLAADVMVITPHRDGMNLVVKEFAVARRGDPVSVVLSPQAGAADELGDLCVLADPADHLALAAALLHADRLPDAARRERSTRMAQIVAAHDVQAWADRMVAAIDARSEDSAAR